MGTGYTSGVWIGLGIVLFYTTVGGFKAVAGNAREATTDLGALRREVEATVRKVEGSYNFV